MNFKDGLLTRRSIRNYKSGIIAKEIIGDLLKTAMYAPSAKNRQPWEFIVVTDKNVLKNIKDNHPFCSFIENAGHALIVCGNTMDEFLSGHWVTDCSAATENFMLACHEKGLGSCWCGIWPDEGITEYFVKTFNLPEHIKPLCLVVFGYPDGSEVRQPSSRFRTDKIHYEVF
ncbi:MAG: nitroreductase family protein [Lactobacillaceae bacterium]|jgi:nitroreductase|nr:nitroreductase family protein [Lactobacillaceae bacterium]